MVDAAHLVLGAWLGSWGCLTRVLLPTPSGRQRLNVLGALHAVTHEVITVTHDTDINSESVVTLLKKLAERFTDLPFTLVLDNARDQRNAYAMVEAERLGMTLLWLPRYSPNLNLIEQLGKFVKESVCTGATTRNLDRSSRRSPSVWPTPSSETQHPVNPQIPDL